MALEGSGRGVWVEGGRGGEEIMFGVAFDVSSLVVVRVVVTMVMMCFTGVFGFT